MATSYSGGMANLTGKQNMLIDSFALMFIGWFSAILFGVLETSITIFGGYDFADPLWTVAGAEISVALLVVMFSVVWVLITNEIDGSDYNPEEFAVIAFALLASVLFIFVPASVQRLAGLFASSRSSALTTHRKE